MGKPLRHLAAALALLLPFPLAGQDKVDLFVLNKIKDEAFGKNSRVMDTAFYLTDVYGPRLTGSPNIKAAGDWAVKTMNGWGVSNTNLEAWGPFGRGWSCTRFSAMMKEPSFTPLIGFARPWSEGTNGPVSGEAMMAVITGPDDLAKFKGKLKGKIVLTAQPHASLMVMSALARRLTEKDLLDAAEAPDPSLGNPAALPLGFLQSGGPPRGGGAPGSGPGGARVNMRQFRSRLNKFLKDEGVLVALTPGSGTDGGDVFGQSAGSQDPKEVAPPASVVITNEHYNEIARLIEKKIPVTLEFDIAAKFTEPADSFNVVGEIPGTDPSAGVVMLGGHFDSWTGGTGATDNAAGAAVSMEAMRILKKLDLKMLRTVRVALWSGEEEGLLGSRAYVKQHFADPADMKLKPEHAKMSAYFNLDNGGGKIRGIYAQDNDMAMPIFQSWLAPFLQWGATTVTIRNTGSTDHMAYDAVGLPGFQFIQDPLEYSTRTHHSNMDLFDRLQPGDMEQASAIMAWFVYNAASRPEMLPRKPLPAAQPERGDRAER